MASTRLQPVSPSQPGRRESLCGDPLCISTGDVWTVPRSWNLRSVVCSDQLDFEVFTYVVVLRARDGRATVPVTLCARPEHAEHAARVIAFLEVAALGRHASGGDPLG